MEYSLPALVSDFVSTSRRHNHPDASVSRRDRAGTVSHEHSFDVLVFFVFRGRQMATCQGYGESPLAWVCSVPRGSNSSQEAGSGHC